MIPVDGVRVGHWTDAGAKTGCTVVLLPAGTVASGEVRGGAPATREMALLEPHRLVDRIDAVVLTGGSAFGLASADGVVRWCEERGMGYPTPAGPVPIVPTLGVFDLAVGDASVRPGPAEGYAACEAAGPDPATGAVGAGTGATVGNWQGDPRPGGLGTGEARAGDVVAWAVAVVNAFGDLDDGREPLLAPTDLPFGNTTVAVVATNAVLDKVGCLLVAQAAHDGLARCLWPVHTRVDGDAVVAAATGEVDAPVELVQLLGERAVEDAIRSAVPGPRGLPDGRR